MINYTDDEKALIYFSQFDFMTSAKFEQVLSYFSSPSQILTCSSEELYVLKDILKKNYEVFLNSIATYDLSFFEAMEKRGIKAITIISKNYPKKLKNLRNPPYVLFYVGNIDLLKETCIAVVVCC